VTVVCAIAMTGGPFSKVAKLSGASIQPRAAGGNFPWEISLLLREKGKRTDVGIQRDFPTGHVILLRGEHALDFGALDLPPMHWGNPVNGIPTGDSFAAAWQTVSAYCRSVAGADGC
jgi:hypothetical protein